jgi:hypothetical protein
MSDAITIGMKPGHRIRISTTACAIRSYGIIREVGDSTVTIEFDDYPGVQQVVPCSQIRTISLYFK